MPIPASEWCLVAATLGAEMSPERARPRIIAADDFFDGIMTTALAEDELLVEARLPLLATRNRFGFYEFSRRAGDYAIAMALVTFRLHDGVDRRAAGRRSAAPKRVRAASLRRRPLLNGQQARRREPSRRGGGRRRRGRSDGGYAGRRRSTGATSCAPSRGVRWSVRAHERADRRRHRPGSAARSAGSRTPRLWPGAAASPPICRRRAGCVSCAARWRAGRIKQHRAPAGAMVDHRRRLAGVKPIRPMLHKFDYVPDRAAGPRSTASCALSASRSRRWSLSSEAEAEDIADLVEVEIAQTAGGRRCDARRSLHGAPRVHAQAPATSSSKAGSKTPRIRRDWAARRIVVIAVELRSRRQNATPLEPRGGHAALRSGHRPRHAHLRHADAASDAHRASPICSACRRPICASIAPDVGGGFGQKMSLPPEYVVLVWLARKLAQLGRLDRGSPREPDRRAFTAATNTSARRARSTPTASCSRSPPKCRQCRRLFLLSDHLRGRAADGDGRDARALRRARLCVPCARRRSPTPVRWRLIAACRVR